MPDKHVALPHSLLGVGAAILGRISGPMTVSALWEAVRSAPEVGTYTRFILALDFLYAVGALTLDDGLLSTGRPA